jgi:ATP-dependent Lhr-like helicase
VERFSAPVRSWFTEVVGVPTPVQAEGWAAIARGEHSLLLAPTGSGKTLAAFLWSLDRLLSTASADGVQVLYVSPLKALVYDIERNLRAPLAGICRKAQALGYPVPEIQVATRTGDTPPRERRQQARQAPQILATTPESLFLLLGSGAALALRNVTTVIVDELHALAPTKRGTHLAVSLERLGELCRSDPQRIGLSATVHPAEGVARFLGGPRPVTIVDASQRPQLDLQVVVPVADMERPTPEASRRDRHALHALQHALQDRHASPSSLSAATAATASAPDGYGLWPALHQQLLQLIRGHRSTLIFVNSRGLCERLCNRLNELAEAPLVRAHHGSVSAAQRREIEEALKSGRLPALVATSSLELGVDMGAIDLVVLVESPGSVSRGLQRVGRAGHAVGQVSVGRIFPKFRGDLLECAVIAHRMCEGRLEPTAVPRSPLDVLAQQLVAMVCSGINDRANLARVVRRANPYEQLSDEALNGVLEMLCGRFPSTDVAELRPLLVWDRSSDQLRPRRGAAWTVRANAGTIPDRGLYRVQLGADGPRLGELDEEMVFETRKGDNILLGASTWRVQDITHDRVIVTPAPGEPGRLPFWHGDRVGRPVEIGRAMGELTRRLATSRAAQAQRLLRHEFHLDAYAARNLVAYIHEQQQHTGTLPTDCSITVERFRDELGDWRVCVLSPFGARIHGPWAMALQRILALRSGFDVQVMYTDDGIALRLADVDELPPLASLFPAAEQLRELVLAQLGDSSLCAALFRENAARALLLARRAFGKRQPLWAQRLRAQHLLAAVRGYAQFPILLETYRQALADVFDLEGLTALLRRIQGGEVAVVEVTTGSASPFARALVFAYVATYLYEQDAPLAERKAQALTLDRDLLAELLGQGELRALLDGAVLTALESELQALAPGRQARDADALHDLLRRLGDLGELEIAARCIGDTRRWLLQLQREKRAVQLCLGSEPRWVADQDAELYGQALACALPADSPASRLRATSSSEEALMLLLARYARGRGPFSTAAASKRFAVSALRAEQALAQLVQRGNLLRGEMRPGGVGPEWCDAEVLRRLKRLTLAKLRQQAAPVAAANFAQFLVRWHGLDGQRGGVDRLTAVVAQLEGVPLPWSVLVNVILPQRVAGFQLEQLDRLAASGRVVWVGCGALGTRDGRVALYRRESVSAWRDAVEFASSNAHEAAIVAHLRQRGASFLFDLQASVQSTLAEPFSLADLLVALRSLVWAGHVTNDTFAPLQTLTRQVATGARGRKGTVATLAGGRWSLVNDLIASPRPFTERMVARTQTLLLRYGVVARSAVPAESLSGGFAAIYAVLQGMEQAGRIRRGYFVEGLAGAQFAESSAVERLRALRDHDVFAGDTARVTVLSAVDPANPYGGLLAWPASPAGGDGGPRRVSGAWVALVDGRLALWASAALRNVLTFLGDYALHEAEYRLVLMALERVPRACRGGLWRIETFDGVAARQSVLAALCQTLGYESEPRGLVVPAWSVARTSP